MEASTRLSKPVSSTGGTPGRGQVCGMKEQPRYPVNARQAMSITVLKGYTGEVVSTSPRDTQACPGWSLAGDAAEGSSAGGPGLEG